MPAKPLYGVYVWLTPESTRSYNPQMYGGARADGFDHALQCFMHQHTLSYVEQALIIEVSEQGEWLGGTFRYQVSFPLHRHKEG
jgi:hypothetical protein